MTEKSVCMHARNACVSECVGKRVDIVLSIKFSMSHRQILDVGDLLEINEIVAYYYYYTNTLGISSYYTKALPSHTSMNNMACCCL